MSSACCVRGASVICVMLYRTSNQVDDLAKFFAKLHIIYINRKLRRLSLTLFKTCLPTCVTDIVTRRGQKGRHLSMPAPSFTTQKGRFLLCMDMYQFAPRLDFTRSWTDRDLYDRYNLSQEECDFISQVVRDMDSK